MLPRLSGRALRRLPTTLQPRVGPEHQQTFALRRLPEMHWTVVPCERAECEHHQLGWVTVVDPGTELGLRQAAYLRDRSGRRFTERRAEGGLVEFYFPAGQQCFTEHRAQREREPLYLIHGGDWRGNPRGVPTVAERRPELWVERFAENQSRIVRVRERG